MLGGMKKTVAWILIMQLILQLSEPKPLSYPLNEEALYAQEVFTKLIHDVMFREMLTQRLQRSVTQENQLNQDDLTIQHGAIIDDELNPNKEQVVNLVLAVSLNWFVLHKWKFLKDVEKLIGNVNVKCRLSDTHATPNTYIVVDIFCYYLQNQINGLSFVPAYKLKNVLQSGTSRDSLQAYNITTNHVLQAYSDDTSKPILNSFFKKHWFAVVIGVTGFALLIIIVTLIMTCIRRHKNVKEGEKLEDSSLDKSVKSTETIPASSITQSNTTPGRNSYAVSPKKSLFSYSPSKISTPIFSFTSPTKFKEKLVYPTSPIETAPPAPVQPQLGLLYPSSLTSSPSKRRFSGSNNNIINSSGNSTEKSRTSSLLQSRRGSSASLVIDVSPRTPTKDLSIPLHESPTEEILQRKSRCMKFREMRRAHANDKELHEEFWGIPPNTVARKDTAMKHSLKNRYPDILPNARSIVRLTGDDRKESGSKYINANFIKGYDGIPDQFIATQGPLACTVGDLWHMVWQYKVSAIVMITKLKEKNKEKCVQYWPSPSTLTQVVYGNVTVTYGSEIQRDGYTIITLYVSRKGLGETRKITHYWFTAWPDHKVPQSCTQVLSLAQEVVDSHGLNRSPIIVHCSAGRGRTGCFIAICNGICQINEDNRVDILKIVSQMRIQRGGMVDKDHQYKFIYNALYEYWAKKLQCSPTLSRSSIEEALEEGEDSCDDDYSSYHFHHDPVYNQPFSFTD